MIDVPTQNRSCRQGDREPFVPTRRFLLAGFGAAALAAAGERATGNSLVAPARRVPLAHFGIDPFAIRDQWSQLKTAFEAAHVDHLALIGHPGAIYRHDGPLTLDGVSFDGQGCTFTPLSDGPQVLRCIGSNWRVANVRLLGAGNTRTPDNWHNGFWVGDESGRSATDFEVIDVVVDAAAPGRGVAAAGFLFNNAHRGRIVRPIVRNSLADGIHVTDGSTSLTFSSPLSENTGDDGFAVVSYRRQQHVCRDIRAIDGISRNSAARGFSVVGGCDITYVRPTIEGASAAGVYLYGEDPYDTFGVARCRVVAPVIRGCVTGRKLPDGFRQAAITIGGREGQDVVEGETLSRGATDCSVHDPIIDEVGPACHAAVSLHQFARRTRLMNARLRNIGSATHGLAVNGIEIGGRDTTVDKPDMRDVAGLAIVVLRTASGRCMVDAPHVVGSRRQPGPIDSFIYADAAATIDTIIVRGGRFSRGPKRLCISLVPPSRLHLLGNRLE